MDDIQSDEIPSSLPLDQAAALLRALLPGATERAAGRFVMFEIAEGGKPIVVATAFDLKPTLVEARYVGGLNHPLCARLKAELAQAFAGSAIVVEPPPPPTFRERLESRLKDLRESGVRIRNLHFGPPALPEQIARIEREHLGFPMPAAFREFFEAHDGLTLLVHTVPEPEAAVFDHSVPLHIESTSPIPWNEAAHDGGPLWRDLDAADFGRLEQGGFFYVGLICIPSLADIFESPWDDMMGWPKGTWMFDAFHPYYYSALVADPIAQTLRIQPTSDYGADMDAAQVEIGDYLEQLLSSGGTSRRVNGRILDVRSAG